MHSTIEMRDVWTIGDVQSLDVEDWWRYEIIDGALVVSPAAGGDHELAGSDLRAVLRPALPEGHVVVGPIGVAVSRSYLVPDLVVAERARVRGMQNLQPADLLLAIEIVSPGSVTMDRLVKPAKYAGAGIAHFWRIETDPVSVTAYRLIGDVYAEVGTWVPGDIARITEPFPVEIDIGRLVCG